MKKLIFNIIELFKLTFDPKYYAKTINELDNRIEQQKQLAKEIEYFKKSMEDEKLGIKSFCRPSEWLEELSKNTKD